MADNPHAIDSDSEEASARDLMSEIQHAAKADEAAVPIKRTARWNTLPVATALVIIAVVLTTINVAVGRAADDRLTPVDQESDAIVRIQMAMDDIEAFRSETGRLPTTLGELGADLYSLDYSAVGSDYALSAVVGSMRISYRSGDSLAGVDEAIDELTVR